MDGDLCLKTLQFPSYYYFPSIWKLFNAIETLFYPLKQELKNKTLIKINVVLRLSKWQNGHVRQKYIIQGDSTPANVIFCFLMENHMVSKERAGLFANLCCLSFKISVWSQEILRKTAIIIAWLTMSAKGIFQLFIKYRNQQLFSHFFSLQSSGETEK